MTASSRLYAGVTLALAAVVPGAAPAGGETPLHIETVLDVSGSMAEQEAGGQSRLAAAKTAVRRLLDGTAMGLRVYGSEYAGEAMGPGC